MTERQKLEARGWIFRPGYEDPNGRFRFDDAPRDAMPAFTSQLLEQGYARVPGGLMEPTRSEKARLAPPLLLMGALALGAVAASRIFSHHTVVDRLHDSVK